MKAIDFTEDEHVYLDFLTKREKDFIEKVDCLNLNSRQLKAMENKIKRKMKVSTRAAMILKYAEIKRDIINKGINNTFTDSLAEVPHESYKNLYPGMEIPYKVYRSNEFVVQLYHKVDSIRISINRSEINLSGAWSDKISWDEIQKIKSDIGFGDSQAIEIYPPDYELINVANIRHIWILDEPVSGVSLVHSSEINIK